jgi:Bacterial EndoU nuclease
MARASAENLAGKLEPERPTADRGPIRDLGERLSGLPSAHPSAVGYSRDRPTASEHLDRDSPEPSEHSDYAAADNIGIAADRRTHILDGDETGSGHRHGTGKAGKTEFPAHWSDDHIIDATVAVAREPDRAPERQSWNDRWQVSGQFDGVGIVAIVQSGGALWTAWPREGSPGVAKNPVEDA